MHIGSSHSIIGTGNSRLNIKLPLKSEKSKLGGVQVVSLMNISKTNRTYEKNNPLSKIHITLIHINHLLFSQIRRYIF
jgi:hypothetical protein